MYKSFTDIKNNLKQIKVCFINAKGKRENRIVFFDNEKQIEDIPEGYYRYSVRSWPNNIDKPKSIEKHVVVGFMGDLITEDNIDFSEGKDYVDIVRWKKVI